MVNKNSKSKSVTKTKVKSVTKKSVGLSKLSLIGLSSIVGAGLLGVGALLKSELLPYIKENYGEYAVGYKKEKEQFDKDYDYLINRYTGLTFKFYMKNRLFRIRQNYIDDKEKIRDYNNGKDQSKQILTLQDYLDVPSLKPFRSRPKSYSLDNVSK